MSLVIQKDSSSLRRSLRLCVGCISLPVCGEELRTQRHKDAKKDRKERIRIWRRLDSLRHVSQWPSVKPEGVL
jgi:hypothetical protein